MSTASRAGGQKFDDIQVAASVRDCLSVPMRTVDVNLVAHSHHIPTHLLALRHDQAGQISEDVTVNRIEQPLGFCQQLVEDHEGRNEFPVYPFG